MNDVVLCEVKNKIATVTINRPKALNALNVDVLRALETIMEDIEHNSEIKVVILTGEGEKAFVAGADIAAMQNMNPSEASSFSSYGQRVFNKIENLSKIVIAAINGFALGGGCELAMACDIRVASEMSKFGIPEVSLGVIPGFGGTQRLPRLVGLGIAKEMLATGKQMTAVESYNYGLVNHVVAFEDLMTFCVGLAESIAKNSSEAISFGKNAMNVGLEMDKNKGLAYETALFGMSFSTTDQIVGMDAFLNKRKAQFK